MAPAAWTRRQLRRAARPPGSDIRDGHLGTSRRMPGDHRCVPDPAMRRTRISEAWTRRRYMGLTPGTGGHVRSTRVHRLMHQRPHRDLRAAAEIAAAARSRRTSRRGRAGLRLVKARREGSSTRFSSRRASTWRVQGCSMCLHERRPVEPAALRSTRTATSRAARAAGAPIC